MPHHDIVLTKHQSKDGNTISVSDEKLRVKPADTVTFRSGDPLWEVTFDTRPSPLEFDGRRIISVTPQTPQPLTVASGVKGSSFEYTVRFRNNYGEVDAVLDPQIVVDGT